jgi:hypothetical protein
MGGARPPPFTLSTITYKVAVYAPAEWADMLTLFNLYQYMYSVVLNQRQTTIGVHFQLYTSSRARVGTTCIFYLG